MDGAAGAAAGGDRVVGDGEPDATAAAGHDRPLAAQIEVQGVRPAVIIAEWRGVVRTFRLGRGAGAEAEDVVADLLVDEADKVGVGRGVADRVIATDQERGRAHGHVVEQ